MSTETPVVRSTGFGVVIGILAGTAIAAFLFLDPFELHGFDERLRFDQPHPLAPAFVGIEEHLEVAGRQIEHEQRAGQRLPRSLQNRATAAVTQVPEIVTAGSETLAATGGGAEDIDGATMEAAKVEGAFVVIDAPDHVVETDREAVGDLARLRIEKDDGRRRRLVLGIGVGLARDPAVA